VLPPILMTSFSRILEADEIWLCACAPCLTFVGRKGVICGG
jgi:hypothetical protein